MSDINFKARRVDTIHVCRPAGPWWMMGIENRWLAPPAENVSACRA